MDKTPNKYQVFLIYFALALTTLAAFWQVRNHEFISFDDDMYVYNNSRVKDGLTREGIDWAFATTHVYNWHPVTWISHMLDCEFYGLDAGGHHFTNVLFHTANALLLLLVLSNATGSLWRSAFVAAAFALHPLHVESVAWVSERKDVLSTFFWMLTMWTYIRYVEHPTVKRYLWILLVFGLGLMAKQMLVTLPFVLLLLDYWPLRRLMLKDKSFSNSLRAGVPVSLRRCIFEKLPLVVLSVVAGAVVYTIQKHTGIAKSFTAYPLIYRVGNALAAYITYIGKMIWPSGLAIFYPYLGGRLSVWQIAGAVFLLVCITVVVIWKARQRPYLTVGWLWYLGTLVPVVGLIQVGLQASADRYTYIPLTGLFIIIAWGIPDFFAKRHYRDVMLFLSGGILLLILWVTTWLQVGHWRNNMTLYKHATEVVANNAWAHHYLGQELVVQGKPDEAIGHFAEAVRIEPDWISTRNALGKTLLQLGKTEEAIKVYEEFLPALPERLPERTSPGRVVVQEGKLEVIVSVYTDAHTNFGIALSRQGKVDEALKHFKEVLRIRPDSAVAHRNLGGALQQLGRLDEAVQYYRQALQIKPDYVDAMYNLAIVLKEQGKINEAFENWEIVLEHDPDHPGVHFNMGLAMAEQGKYDEAIRHFEKVLRTRPDWPMVYFKLATIYHSQGRLEMVVEQCTKALSLKPDFIDVRVNLARVLLRLGRLRVAIEQYHEILNLEPYQLDALKDLAWLLATVKDAELRNPTDAVKFAQRACELTKYNQPEFLNTLAVAYAAAGRFIQAIETSEKGINLAQSAGKKSLAKEMQKRLELYKAGKAYR